MLTRILDNRHRRFWKPRSKTVRGPSSTVAMRRVAFCLVVVFCGTCIPLDSQEADRPEVTLRIGFGSSGRLVTLPPIPVGAESSFISRENGGARIVLVPTIDEESEIIVELFDWDRVPVGVVKLSRDLDCQVIDTDVMPRLRIGIVTDDCEDRPRDQRIIRVR